MCSYKLIATPIANPGELHFEQGAHHYDLHSFLYNMVDMHHLTPNIQEVMRSTMWLTDKLGYIAIFGPMKEMSPQLQNL
jgi:hypothetical protein